MTVVVVPGSVRTVRTPTPAAPMLGSVRVFGPIPPNPPEPASVVSTSVLGGTMP